MKTLPALAALLLVSPTVSHAADDSDGGDWFADVPASEAEAIRMQREELSRILTGMAPRHVATRRSNCVVGNEGDPYRDEGLRADPDPSDLCLATLLRSARDGTLIAFYRDLLADHKMNTIGYEKLPATIANAAVDLKNKVVLPDGTELTFRPALAFDVGFTVGYQAGPHGHSGQESYKNVSGETTVAGSNAEQLKTSAEDCLMEQGDDTLCYAVGFRYGSEMAGKPRGPYPWEDVSRVASSTTRLGHLWLPPVIHLCVQCETGIGTTLEWRNGRYLNAGEAAFGILETFSVEKFTRSKVILHRVDVGASNGQATLTGRIGPDSNTIIDGVETWDGKPDSAHSFRAAWGEAINTLPGTRPKSGR